MNKTNIFKFCFGLLLLSCLVGCSLIPKKVEFFQDKVERLPTKTQVAIEREKQAAKYVSTQVDEAFSAGLTNDSPPAVMVPLNNAKIVAPALSESLGPPKKEWSTNSDNAAEQLAKALTSELARLNNNIEKFRKDNDENAGKKIEGTGLIQIPYFIYLIVVVTIIGIILVILKAMAHAASIANPTIGLGLNAMKITAREGGIIANQLIKGGEQFKDLVVNSVKDVFTKDEVKDLFRQAHMTSQSPEVQTFIQNITK